MFYSKLILFCDYLLLQNPELLARLERLKAEQENKEYKEMTRSVNADVSVFHNRVNTEPSSSIRVNTEPSTLLYPETLDILTVSNPLPNPYKLCIVKLDVELGLFFRVKPCRMFQLPLILFIIFSLYCVTTNPTFISSNRNKICTKFTCMF